MKTVRDFVFKRSGDGCDLFKIFIYLTWFILGSTTFVHTIIELDELPNHNKEMIGIIVASCPGVTLSLLPILVWEEEAWIILQNCWTFSSSVILLVFGSNIIHALNLDTNYDDNNVTNNLATNDFDVGPISPKLAISHSIVTGIMFATTLYFHFLFRRLTPLVNENRTS